MNSPLKQPMGPYNWLLWESPRVCSQIRKVQFFEKINFLGFWGPEKTFLSAENPIWPKKPRFGGGGHTSKSF